MRKRRIILYDDDLVILNILKMFFELKDYEVIACSEPARCPVYNDNKECDKRHPCCDLMITDYLMPRMSGIELLRAQARMGCRLTPKNKLIMSGCQDDEVMTAVEELGCSFMKKPFSFADLEVWIQKCEERMDLDQPLGFKRRELRSSCC